MDKHIAEGRIKHMHGVAEYMYANAEKYNLVPEEMYFLGLNHDIGYIKGKPEHESYGAVLLQSLGLSQELSDIIRYHGTTPSRYKFIFNCFDGEIPEALVLLWEADMHVDQSGEDVGYNARLEDIGNRLGTDSEAYCICKETIEWLRNRDAIEY